MGKEERSLYGWAFVAGKSVIQCFETLYGVKRAEKRMENILLTLRSELLPERFKRALINSLIEIGSEVGIPEEVKVEKRWNVDEFYRYSTAILAGFFDALNWWRGEKRKEKEQEKEE